MKFTFKAFKIGDVVITTADQLDKMVIKMDAEEVGALYRRAFRNNNTEST